jgi:hypothetical protein
MNYSTYLGKSQSVKSEVCGGAGENENEDVGFAD